VVIFFILIMTESALFCTKPNPMKTATRYFFVLFSLLLFFSCKNSVDLIKRRYTGGYYVEHSGKRAADKKESSVKMKKDVSPQQEQTTVAFAEQKQRPSAENQKTTENDAEPVAQNGGTGPGKKDKAACDKTQGGLTSQENVALHKEPKLKTETHRNKYDGDIPVSGAASDTALFILLILLAIFIPPLAVYIKQKEITKWFWITLILCLLTGFGRIASFLFSFWFVAFVIALLVVLDVIR
jgi:uncharacterized membrane protein YqaE (UPF0057 family)